MEVRLLLCKRVLARIPEEDHSEDDAIYYLRNWLSEHETKAVVLLQDWREFVAQWEHEIGEFPEARMAFFAIHRGIITPYRDKYADEAGVKPDGETTAAMNEVDAMKTITRRHYDTCEYLVTDVPSVFRGRGLVLPDPRIVTPALFRAIQQESVGSVS